MNVIGVLIFLALCNWAVICPNSGTPKILNFHLEQMENLLFLGVPILKHKPGRIAQWVGHLTRESGVLGSIPGLATYFRFSFRFFKKDSCQLLAKVCA